jgi:uncharacterized protein DUF559
VVREHGFVLTTQEALAAGITVPALAWARRKGRLRSLRQGVHTSAGVWDEASAEVRHALELLAHQRVRPELVACGLSAAAVLGLPLPTGPPPQPQLTEPRAPTPAPPARRKGAEGRRAGALLRCSWLSESEVRTTRGGLRVTSPVRTVLDCARELDAPWGLAVADAALTGLRVTTGRLASAVATHPPVPGRRARWVVEHARPGVESPLESLARAVIVLAGLPEPTPQVWVGTGSGSFRVDLLDEVNRVITEADGKLKYTAQEDLWKEKRREDALRAQGFEVVRFTMSDYHQPQTWLPSYTQALARAVPPKSR